ncbi:MAG: hypothetical protein GXO19_04605 [Epsilonproteobacteria bacterium]|nr:hypothetical protein [Campylobacterota bacterium]
MKPLPSIEKITTTYRVTDERHPYNIWGEYKKKGKRKKKKGVTASKRGRKGKIDIYV